MVGVAIGTQVQAGVVRANILAGGASAHLALAFILEFCVALQGGRGQKLHLLRWCAVRHLDFGVVFADSANQSVINALVVLNIVCRKILPFCTSRQLKP